MTCWGLRGISATRHTQWCGATSDSAIHFVKDEGNPSGVHLFQWVKDVDASLSGIVGRGVVVSMEPTNQPYGIRELGIRDVNGMGIVFGQDIEHDPR